MSTITGNGNLDRGVDPAALERMHREIGDFLQDEVNRGEGPGLIKAGFHEGEVPEPIEPAEFPEDDAEERAKAALSAGHSLVGHETEQPDDTVEPDESPWTDRAKKLVKQGIITSGDADFMSGLGRGRK
jgi:hypothetical protein